MRSSIVGLCCALLFAAACSLNAPQDSQSLRPAETPQPIEAPPQASTASGSAASVTTYTDNLTGFAFDYPTGWTIPREPPHSNAVIYSITIASYDYYNAGPGRERLPDDVSKIDITAHAADTALESIVERIRQGSTERSAPVIEEQQRALVDGTPAVYQHIRDEFGTEVYVLTTIIHGRVVSVTGYGDKAYFEVVAGSLRPV